MALEVDVNVVRRSVGVAVVIASLALSTPALAGGLPATHRPAKHPAPRSAHHARTYREAMVAIDATFARSVADATRLLHVRMARAKTSADQIDARNQYRLAIVKATRLREVEVELLDQSPLGKNNPDRSVTTTVSGGTDSSGTGDN